MFAMPTYVYAYLDDDGNPTDEVFELVESITDELIRAANGEYKAMTTRDQTHRMAEANKAFSHFAR